MYKEKNSIDQIKKLENISQDYKNKENILQDKDALINGFIIEGSNKNYKNYLSKYFIDLFDEDYKEINIRKICEDSNFEQNLKSALDELRNTSNKFVLFSNLEEINDRTAWKSVFHKELKDLEDFTVILNLENLDNFKNDGLLHLNLYNINIDFVSRNEILNILEDKISAEDLSDEIDFNNIISTCKSMNRENIKTFIDRLIYNSIENNQVKINKESIKNTRDQMAEVIGTELKVRKPSITYEDVGGLKEEKDKIKKIIEWPIEDSNLFEKMSAKTSKGVLLYGPPGNGKTLLASAVAGASNYNMVEVKCSDIMQKFLGQSESKINQIFQIARQNSPSIIFLDEFDAIGRERKSSGKVKTTSTAQRVVSELLVELDGMDSKDDVKIIAATNKPKKIDKALLRSGRISEKIEISRPQKQKDIKEILSIHLRDKPHKNINKDKIASKLNGCTGGDIEKICDKAALIRIEKIKKQKNTEKEIQQKDLIEAITDFNSERQEEKRSKFEKTYY